MQHTTGVLAAVAFLLFPGVALASDVQNFDGNWQTTVSCSDSRGGLGYSYRFISVAKDGVFHGLHGTAGQSGSLQIDGTIEANGTATLYAKGLTGSKEYVPGRDTPRGTEYGYHIKAHFEGSTGTGTRIEGRPCSIDFVKQ
ncbi:MAG: hypothetical protein WCF13_01535 [Stellaceae bacterium]